MATKKQPTCLIGQSACGRIAGEPVCPKCGLVEGDRYVSEEAGLLAASKAEAQYWKNESNEILAEEAQRRAEDVRLEIERGKAEEAKRQAAKARQEMEQRRKEDDAKRQAEIERLEQDEVKRLAAEQARRKPGRVFQDLPIAPQMVVLPSGSFLMGSAQDDAKGSADERPQHKVTIAYSLAMGRYPVTSEEWDACVADGGTSHKPKNKGGKLPASNVSWEDAQAFVRWLNTKLGIDSSDRFRYRLPSEAEWEYACRAGSQTQWYFGDDEDQLEQFAWYGAWISGRHPVGQKAPNAFGLYDMHGNVREWVEDCDHDTYSGAPSDGSAWVTGNHQQSRGLRGGSWGHDAMNTRAARRVFYRHDIRQYEDGFRLAKTLP